jgi:organic hydroperoxide reductase OsmC/OhrA
MAPTAKTFGYEVALTWEGGRTSRITAGARPDLLSAPPEDFPGGDPARWSPEHLFLGSIASCTLLSFLAHADHAGVAVQAYRATAGGTITRRAVNGRYAFITVELRPHITVAAGHRSTAFAITAKAERDCFITASTNAEVTVYWEIDEQ